jgi:hypothetical protein
MKLEIMILLVSNGIECLFLRFSISSSTTLQLYGTASLDDDYTCDIEIDMIRQESERARERGEKEGNDTSDV